jgi:hypothetical protein
MQYGSIVGHGAYLGPDYTADYLRRATDFVENKLRNAGTADPRGAVIEEFRTNRYDEASKTLTLTDNQAEAFKANEQYYAQFFGEDSTKNGLVPGAITDPNEIHQLTSFFAWTAWAAAANRPGHSYSYTNNWPPEPRVANGPTADVVVWSVLSLVVLLGGIGALFAIYGRWSSKVGWRSAEAPAIAGIFLTFIWIVIIYRGIRGRLKGESKGNMPWLFFFAALAIPAFYEGRAASQQPHPPNSLRILAILGGASVGRGLPRTLHHGDGGVHLRHARRDTRTDRAGRDLPRCDLVLGRRGHRHHAPSLLLGHPG